MFSVYCKTSKDTEFSQNYVLMLLPSTHTTDI